MEPLPEHPVKSTKYQKIIRWLLYGVVSLAIVFGLILLFWGLQNPTMLTVKGAPFPVKPDVNTPNSLEVMYVDYCKLHSGTGSVVARMIGKKSIIRLPWPAEAQPKGCLKSGVPILIPSYAIDDRYYFDFEITYKVNPLKTSTVTFRSQTFTVKADGKVVR